MYMYVFRCFMIFYCKFWELTLQLNVHSISIFISERAYSPRPFCYKEHLFLFYVTRATNTPRQSEILALFPAVYSKYHVQHISAAIPALIAGRCLSGMQIMRRKCGTVEWVIMLLGGGHGLGNQIQSRRRTANDVSSAP